MPRRRCTSMLLECKHNTDDSWHDSEVSLVSVGKQTVLNVRYPGLEDNEEDNIYTANEARSRLRPRSKMLENGQCLQLQEGDIVLASRRSELGKIYSFDAQIEQVERQKHSARVSCKCSFKLMWLDKKMKGEVCTVSASQIHLINQRNIQDHPIIFEWLQSVRPEDGHQPEPSDIGSDVQAQLEEEIDKITMMADTLDKDHLVDLPVTSLAQPPSDYRQSSRRKAPARKRSAKGPLENTVEVSTVRTSSRKRAQSSAEAVVEDGIVLTVPSPFDKRPRLSPLAARAALAATVQTMPLGQPSSGTSPLFLTKPLEKPTQKNAGSARKRLTSKSVVEEDETKSLNEIRTAGEAQEYGKRPIRRGARDSSRRSPVVSLARPNFLSPIKESPLESPVKEALPENQWEIRSENMNVKTVVTPLTDTLNHNTLRERTNRTSKAGEQEYVAKRETAEVAAKKARRKGEIISLRSSARLRKETTIRASPLLESNEETHSTAETTDNNTIQQKFETIETDGGVSLGIKRTRKSTSARSSRSKLSCQSTSVIEGESGVDDIGLSKVKESRAGSEITSADDKVQDPDVIESKKRSSRKTQPMKRVHPNKKSKIVVQEPSCSDTRKLEEKSGQTTSREEIPLAAATIDVTVELVADIQNSGDVGEIPSPHRLKLRTRKVSFDALPVGFGLGITGWLPSPGSLVESQHTPPPCEVDPERSNTVDLHIEAADVINTVKKSDGEKTKKAGREKAAALFYKAQGTGESLEATSKNRLAEASNVNENEHLASEVGKKLMFASVLVQSNPCYGGDVHTFSSSEMKHKFGGEVMWSSSPACVNPGKKSANSFLVSVFSGQSEPSEGGATSVAMVERESGKRSKGSSASVLSVQDGVQGLQTTRLNEEERNVRRSSGRPAKRIRKMRPK